MYQQQQLHALDRATLEPIVRRALGSSTAELLTWGSHTAGQLGGMSNITTGGVYRVWGQAVDRGVACSWSLIVKVLKSPAGVEVADGIVISEEQAEDQTRFAYWRREAGAFASGRLEQLGGSLVAPRCFGITERPDRQVWLWLEDLTGGYSPATAPDLEVIARHLGSFNGSSLGYQPGDGDGWMSRGWLRSWLETAIVGFVPNLERAELWEHPVLRRAYPEPIRERLLRLWRERELLLAALERQPQVFCHLDAYLGNLFVREQHTVAVDWAFAGMAAPGEELSALIVGTALVGFGEVASIKRIEQRAIEGYLAGLRAAGWDGNPHAVRLAYLASAALRYGFLGPELPLRSVLEPDYQAQTVQRLGRPWKLMVEQRAALTYLLLDYADEALAILG